MSDSAEVEWWTTALSAGVSSVQQQIFLVSQSGDKFGVNADVAKRSSEYFSAVLETGMTEAGEYAYAKFVCMLNMFVLHLQLKNVQGSVSSKLYMEA